MGRRTRRPFKMPKMWEDIALVCQKLPTVSNVGKLALEN